MILPLIYLKHTKAEKNYTYNASKQISKVFGEKSEPGWVQHEPKQISKLFLTARLTS